MRCGSGRFASAVAGDIDVVYVELDTIPDLLAYARRGTSARFRFEEIVDLSLPLGASSARMIAVFAHMLSSEAYLFLRDMKRVLKPGGCVVVSFIEIAEPEHWADFMADVESHATNTFLHQFIERPTIDIWCEKSGLCGRLHR